MKKLFILLLLCGVWHVAIQAQNCPDATLIMNLSTPLNLVCNTKDLTEIKFYGSLAQQGTQLIYPGAQNTFTWSTDGKGTFSPQVDNGANSRITYSISPQDYSYGIVDVYLHGIMDQGQATFYNCNRNYDGQYVVLLMKYTVDAGANQLVCINTGAPQVQVQAKVTSDNFVFMAFVSQWVSLGSGTFQDDTKMSTVYTPSQADINQGSVKLVTKIRKNQCQQNDFVSDTLTLTFGVCNANEQAQQTETFLLFPNPAHDQLTIKTMSSSERKIVVLYNASGHEVCRRDIEEEETISLAFPKGIYQAQLISGDKSWYKKMVIE